VVDCVPVTICICVVALALSSAAAVAAAAAAPQADSKRLAKAEKAKARGNDAFKQAKYRCADHSPLVTLANQLIQIAPDPIQTCQTSYHGYLIIDGGGWVVHMSYALHLLTGPSSLFSTGALLTHLESSLIVTSNGGGWVVHRSCALPLLIWPQSRLSTDALLAHQLSRGSNTRIVQGCCTLLMLLVWYMYACNGACLY
jgi:hypothetical protein